MVNKFLPRFLRLNPNPFGMEKDECGAVQGLACFSKQAGLGNMEWSRIAEFARSNDESAHEKLCLQVTEAVLSMFSKRANTVSFRCRSSVVSCLRDLVVPQNTKTQEPDRGGGGAKKAGIHPRPFGPASIPAPCFGYPFIMWNPLAPSF
jgi:hypothetical protein